MLRKEGRPSLEHENAAGSVFPTPNSLESKSSPWTYRVVKDSAAIEDLTFCEGHVPFGLPLINGPVKRRLGISEKNRPARRMRLNPYKPPSSSITQTSSTSSSFGIDYNKYGSKSEKGLLTLDIPIIKRLPIEWNRTTLIKDLSQNLTSNPFGDTLRISQASLDELRSSLMSVFYPICETFGASIDTAFLAHGILAKYAQAYPPIRAITRSQLYVACLLIAFKYNEEEDPKVQEISETIFNSSFRPTSFVVPSTDGVLKMEQKIMKVIGWKIADIVLPMVLLYALFDCIPIELTLGHRRALASCIQQYLATVISSPERSLPPEVYIAELITHSLICNLGVKIGDDTFMKHLRAVWRLLRPQEWPALSRPPQWTQLIE